VFGGLTVLANQRNKRLRGARQTPIAPVNQSQFTVQIDALDGEQFHFAGFHLILRKASLINETPASAPTKRLIIPMLGNSMVTCRRDRYGRNNLSSTCRVNPVRGKIKRLRRDFF